MKMYRIVEIPVRQRIDGIAATHGQKFHPETSEDNGVTWNRPAGTNEFYTLDSAKRWCKIDETQDKVIIHPYP